MSKKPKREGAAKQDAPERDSPHTAQGAAAGEVLDWRWAELLSSHPGHPALDAPAIYALPPELIDALQKPHQKFFSADEECFERDLARLGGGFFLKRPIVHPLLPDAKLNEAETFRLQEHQKRQQRSTEQIDQMLADEMRKAGWSDQEIRDHCENEQAIKTRIEERQWGYLGWLVTDAGFRQVRDALCERWGEQIVRRGGFPQIRMSWFGERPPEIEESERELHMDFHAFYRAWGLDRLVTWELPEPMRAELSQPSLYFSPDVGEAGFMVFVPWYLFRDKDLKLREIAEHKRDIHAPHHLNEWLSGKPKRFGFDRFAKMLEIYVYLELALRNRYGDRLRGKTDEMDHAFGSFLYGQGSQNWSGRVGADNVKKIRQKMKQRLGRSA